MTNIDACDASSTCKQWVLVAYQREIKGAGCENTFTILHSRTQLPMTNTHRLLSHAKGPASDIRPLLISTQQYSGTWVFRRDGAMWGFLYQGLSSLDTADLTPPGNLARTQPPEYANVQLGKLKFSPVGWTGSVCLSQAAVPEYGTHLCAGAYSVPQTTHNGPLAGCCTTLTPRHCNVWAGSICSQGGSSRPSIEPTDVLHDDASLAD